MRRRTFYTKMCSFSRRTAAGTAAVAVIGGGAVAVTASPADAATCRSYVYSSGGTSVCIEYIQRMLNTLSAHWGNLYYHESPEGKQLAVDGAYGANTQYEVTKFQQAIKALAYPVTVDGIVGPQTWSYLCEQISDGKSEPGWANGVAAGHSAGCF